MATNDCFVSPSGSDSTGAGSATNPYKTIGKAIGSSPAFTLSTSLENRLILAPGIYRELVALGVSPTSAGPLTIVGDADGSIFSAAGGTGTAGPVEWRGWTDDVTPTSSGELLAASSKSYVSLKRLKMIGGGGSGVSVFNLSGTLSNWAFEDVVMFGTGTHAFLGNVDGSAGAALNVSFKRCDFVSVASSNTYVGVRLRAPLSASEWDMSVLFQNCNFFGSADSIQYVTNGGSGTKWGSGVRIQQCGFWFCTRGFRVASNPALTTPLGVYGCTFAYSQNCIVASTSGQIVEDGNVYMACATALTSVSPGAHSVSSACPAFSLNDDRIFGGVPRPWGEPSAVSPTLAAGNYGTPPSVDAWNQARPATPSAGALERDVFAVPTNTYIFQCEG